MNTAAEHIASSRKKKLWVKTFGCQMNEYDSAAMIRVMSHVGYELCTSPEEADMAVFNTCHIREKAAEKLYSDLGRLREIKQARKSEGGELLIAVAGCVAQAEGEEIFARAPYVDVVTGPQAYHQLPDLVSKVERRSGKRAISLDFARDKFDKLPEETFLKEPGVGYLSIQEGCDKFCTFCVVPYTRGAEYSRSAAEIIREAQRLLAAGAQELTLLGQNVNAYHGAGPEGEVVSLGALLHTLAAMGTRRLRYTTSHPRDMHEALYRAHASLPALAPFLSLPVQSGSDAVLESMNRKHTRREYFKIIDTLRASRPGMRFGSDFIVGFPGETRKDVDDTLDLISRVGFIQGYSFKYSPRPGTPGAERRDAIDEAEKDKRLYAVQALLRDQQQAFAAENVGQIRSVLFTGPGRRPGQLIGRSEYMQSVHVDHENGAEDAWIGNIVDVKITDVCSNSLRAQAL